ncbi:MAG: S-methyl-5-thioribose-1-phosphate isomerase [Candidatus Altiarchaeota archaeon]|nr:S-methyl-5-thioribose-1-phosphate isomerase [Candidatus Altiarchaeota archaeon]
MKVKFNSEVRDYRTVWMEGSVVYMIDQPKLPHRFETYGSKDYRETVAAIKNMVVRGAPAIGATAAFGVAQAALEFKGKDFRDFLRHMEKAEKTIKNTRPTAYDLFYAVKKMMDEMRIAGSVDEAQSILRKASQKYADESAGRCRLIGLNGEPLIKDSARVLTHCNAGALGCVDHGTALAPIRAAEYDGKNPFVFIDETRPRCQGSRLTAWELVQEDIKHCIIVDNAAGYLMRKGEIDLVIVGADRINSNGDVVNKIGTYEKAVLARENSIPFYVAAPESTFDFHCKTVDDVEIEERDEDEVLYMWGLDPSNELGRVRIAPKESGARNPAFDITPTEYVSKIITEEGVYKPEEISKRFG